MDPLSIIASTLAILDGVSKSYTVMRKLISLPKAFKAVRDQLPLAEQLLETAKVVLENNPDATTPVSDCLRACKQKAILLGNIFEDLKDTAKGSTHGNNSESGEEWTGSRVATAYKMGLLRFKRMARANKVEKLMKDIMTNLDTLSTFQEFKAAATWQNKLEEITVSIDALTEVTEQHPSIDDGELPDHHNEYFRQEIHDYATGYQNQTHNYGNGDLPVVQGVGGENNQFSFGRYAQTTNNSKKQ